MSLRFVAVLTLVLSPALTSCKSGGGANPPSTVAPSTQAPSEPGPITQASPSPDATSSSDASTSNAAQSQPNVIPTDGPELRVTALEHGSVMLSWGEHVIYVDPVSSALDAATKDAKTLPEADLVLVTHVHGDHLDPAAIARVRKEGARVVVPRSVADKAGEALPSPTILANGETAQMLDGQVEVEAFPMYNLVRKRDNGEFFHPKGAGNGYLIRLGGRTIYVSGDTECTPEMKQLEKVDVAFLCMNLPYTMPVEEAAECVRAFEPAVLFPYHYRGQDPEKLDTLLADLESVDVRHLDWYDSASQ